MTGNITDATMYLEGAQITRAERFKLKAGVNTVTFSQIPAITDVQSIIVEAEGAHVVSVTHTHSLSESDNEKRISDLSRKMDGLQKELESEEHTIKTLDFEEELLKNNSRVSDGKEFKASDIKDTVIFFRDRMMNISSDRAAAVSRGERLKEEISSISAEIGVDRMSRQRSEVNADVYTGVDGEVLVKLTYYTQDAGWTPYYDVRAEDVDSPVTLQSKATVFQHTGEDWNEVSLTLSTGNPSLSGDVPELYPWYIDAEQPILPVHRMKAMPLMAKVSDSQEPMEEIRFEQTETMTSVEYALKAPYSMESSGNGKAVDIESYELPATYMYKSVRKLEKDVFLIAEAEGWERLNIMAGDANIFFEGKFVGTTHIDPAKADGPLTISLGRDRNVIVNRTKGKDFTSKSVLGGSVKLSREWELTVRNLKKQKISMVLEDQIPVSVNKAITVDTIETSGAEMDKDTGKLTWKFDLESAGTKKMTVKYEVSHPKTMNVRLE